jgi:hypothetical protein
VRTALAIVAVPEEMAVVEAIELQRRASEELGMDARAVFLNACHEARFTPAQEAQVLALGARGAQGSLAGEVSLPGALMAARRHIRRRKLTRFYQAKLRRELPLPLVSLPYLFAPSLDMDALRTLVARLEAA